MNTYKCRRKAKRHMNHLHKKARKGKYVIDCRNHPCIVTETHFYGDIYGDDIEVQSLVTGTMGSCSLFHCGPEPISKAEAFERAELAKRDGWEAYLKKFSGYTEEDLLAWRKMQAIWGFETDKPRVMS